MINKLDMSVTPSKEEIKQLVGYNYSLIDDFCNFVESKYKPKEQIDYSKCNSIPGWNLKYKKQGRAVCTVYPYDGYFSVLVTLTFDDLDKFDIVKNDFSAETQKTVSETKTFNGTKWIILNVAKQSELDDIKKLIAVKYE